MIEVKLEFDENINIRNEYVCDITRDLDKMSNLDSEKLFHHYIIYDKHDLENHLVCIRVPGGTVGYIKYDDNFIIIEIFIDTNYVVKTYSKDVNNEINKKYIGGKLILL